MTLFHQNDAEHFKGWWYRRDETHISFYTGRTFEKLAELTGLNVLFKDPKNICVLHKTFGKDRLNMIEQAAGH